MSLTPSTMLELGTRAPDFSLPDVRTGQTVSLAELQGKDALLVLFMCAHCPFVKLVEAEFAAIGRDYQSKGLGLVAISANDAENYPDDAPQRLREQAERLGFTFPYLYDESQEAARAYRAACTPDLYLFDRELKLAYRGQLDDARPGNGLPVNGKNLRAAINSVLAGKKVTESQLPATGCNIKWKPGNEPDYFG
jgi:peroxiredoxin